VLKLMTLPKCPSDTDSRLSVNPSFLISFMVDLAAEFGSPCQILSCTPFSELSEEYLSICKNVGALSFVSMDNDERMSGKFTLY
jgi:hypothetical protein